MSDIKIAVAGAGGRMGAALIHQIENTSGIRLAGALEHSASEKLGIDSGKSAGLDPNGIAITDDTNLVLSECDGIIDFTMPAATLALSKAVGDHNCFHIIGTTGCTSQEEAELAEAGNRATIVKSGNMSLGVNLLAILVEQAAAALSATEFDIEVLEMHHRHKVDAPSGTALLLGEAAARGRNLDLSQNSVRSRDGITGERDEGSIGFATLRGGAVIGDHSVILASDNERIELTHKAQDRSLFSAGAVQAAIWAHKKPNGFYSMRDVLGI